MNASSVIDESMMQRAVELAARGLYTTHPNPRVGCVITLDEKIVGEGWHIKAGETHAEVNALQQAGERARGATAYVTLEPCSHTGRTPPCSDALINAGIKRVVYGMRDPNPLVNGQGIAKLRMAGIAVEGPVCEAEVRELNRGFIKRMQQGLPLVRIKMGMSADGRTALSNGISKWITSETSRADVQHWRARSSAVMTGSGTILSDDPQLNVRSTDIDTQGRQVLRVICDTHLRMPATAKVATSGGTVVYTLSQSKVLGTAEVIQVNADDQGKVDLTTVLRELAMRGCNEVLVEAGATLTGRLLSLKLVDEIILYIAPVLLGQDAQALFTLPPISSMAQRIDMQLVDTLQLGSDIRLHYRIV